MFYAKIDETGLCVGIQQNGAEINDPAYVAIGSFDISYLGRYYIDGQWQ